MSHYVYLITPLCAWVVAQTAKLLLNGRKKYGFIDLYHLYRSGGMPSAHTAIIVSLATIIGLEEGFSSIYFGIAGVMAMIVVYDAVNVRYIVGEQGRVLAKLLAENKGLAAKLKSPRVIRGHTLPEVIAGAVVGVSVALIIFLLKNS